MCVKHTNSKNLSVIAHNRDLNVFAIELTFQNVSVIATCLKSFRFNLLNHFPFVPSTGIPRNLVTSVWALTTKAITTENKRVNTFFIAIFVRFILLYNFTKKNGTIKIFLSLAATFP